MYVLLPTKIELVRKANIYVTIEGYKGKITEILILAFARFLMLWESY